MQRKLQINLPCHKWGRCIRLSLHLAAVILLGVKAAAESPPIVAGLQGQHPLTERQKGAVLIDELRCAACHEGINSEGMKAAPDLRGVGSRLSSEFIRKFIGDPAGVHLGTTMPALFSSIPLQEREADLESITAYLTSLREDRPNSAPPADADVMTGRDLFHSVGCVACHSPRDESGKEMRKGEVVSLSHLPGKYLTGQLAAFIHDPLKVRPSGRMPDLKLGRDEAASIAAYLEGHPGKEVNPGDYEVARISAGKRAFEANRCTSCHQLDDTGLPESGPPLEKLDLSRGCLSEGSGRAPQFHLEPSQRQSIRAALEEPPISESAAEQIKIVLTRMNCIACHSRDDFGGVAPSLSGHFQSIEVALGNEGRLPPPLTGIGGKLRPSWLHAVLYDGRSVRPYMTTRMPQFGEDGLGRLADHLMEVDRLPAVKLPDPEESLDQDTRDAALRLLGDKGLNCLACHNYNGKEGPGIKGLDIMTSYQRLEPAWFFRFMKDPAAFRPGIIMPSSWPDGTAVRTDILGGDTDGQLTSIYNYLSLGTSAADPSGLRTEPSKLVVTDRAITYRGRSSIAGYRGIAVGLPGGVNYAFNAQNGALSAIWSNDFVHVNWHGQGAGDFSPVGEPVRLAQDVAFMVGLQAPDRWPLRPITTKENPVNPDPLYPRQHGYQFVGYSLDEADSSVPMFEYRFGSVSVRDRSVALQGGGKKWLRRTLEFSAPAATAVWLRGLTGTIEGESETAYKIPGLRISISPAETEIRPMVDGGKELLIKLPLNEGVTLYCIDYELLR
jgi:mono/diheme cytochrome c family protein/anti-sigma factor RsiW